LPHLWGINRSLINQATTIDDMNKEMGIKELKNRYQLLQDLMDNIPDVIYFKDKLGRLVLVNQAYARGLGISPEQAVGKTDFDIFPKARARKMLLDDLKVLTCGKPMIDKVERATRPDGVDNYVSTTKVPRFDAKGKIAGLIGITRDITRRVQAKSAQESQENIRKKIEHLKELSHLKSDFVSAVSHELRTPLAIIKDAVGLLDDGTAGALSVGQKKLIENAAGNIRRLQHIIDELLDISRIESGRLKLHYSLACLNDLIIDSSDFFKKLSKDKGLRLQYLLPKNEVNIFIDVERIIQVMHNLISNAIKFTEEGGEISVGLGSDRGRVLFWVQDSGVGVAREDLPKLFHKFVQVSSLPQAHKKGLGLGLAISRELVEKHGGKLWVESKLGVGSKFIFSLPSFYALGLLDKKLRDKINGLLSTSDKVYLVNLFLVHFALIRKRIKIKPKVLSADLAGMIKQVFSSLCADPLESFEIIAQDSSLGEYKVILALASEEKVRRVCTLLKRRISTYFSQNKIENVFVNIGKLPYNLSKEKPEPPEDAANFAVKNIHIGLEKRKFRRYDYLAEIELDYQNKQNVRAKSADISQGGVNFISPLSLKAKNKVRLKLKFPGLKSPLDISARVAWVRPADGLAQRMFNTGLEFVGLKSGQKQALKSFMRKEFLWQNKKSL